MSDKTWDACLFPSTEADGETVRHMEEEEAIHHVGVIVSFPRGGTIMSRALNVLREERALLQRQLSAVDRAIAALSGGLVSSGRKVGVKKHGRVWTPAMKAAASKRAKARWAKKGKMK